MPIHDWSKVPSGLFHDFHQHWSIEIAAALNRERLPKGIFALLENKTGPHEPEHRILGLISPKRGGVMPEIQPTQTFDITSQIFARKATSIVLKNHLGRTIAVIKLVSPGNKDGRRAFREFIDASVECLSRGVHLLLVDLFPPTKREPEGLHNAICEELGQNFYQVPPSKNRSVVSYEVGDTIAAYIQPLSTGDKFEDTLLFFYPKLFVMVPLESTYMAAWEASPEIMRRAVETGVVPNPDADE